MGDIDGALQDFNKAIELDTNNAVLYNNRADFWLIQGECDKALVDINIAIEKDNSEYISFVTREKYIHQ